MNRPYLALFMWLAMSTPGLTGMVYSSRDAGWKVTFAIIVAYLLGTYSGIAAGMFLFGAGRR